MQFKVAYIQAFNAMEASLRAHGLDERFLSAVREIVAPLAVRCTGQDEAIDRVAALVDVIAEEVASFANAIDFRGDRPARWPDPAHLRQPALGRAACARQPGPSGADAGQRAGAAGRALRCDGTDRTQLAELRSQFPRPNDYVILEQRFSKEPYGPVVRRDDREIGRRRDATTCAALWRGRAVRALAGQPTRC